MKSELDFTTHVSPLLNALKFLETTLESDFVCVVGYLSLNDRALKEYRVSNMAETEQSKKLKQKIGVFFEAFCKSEKLPVFSSEDVCLLSKAINRKIDYLTENMKIINDSNVQGFLALPALDELEKDKKVLRDAFCALAFAAEFK